MDGFSTPVKCPTGDRKERSWSDLQDIIVVPSIFSSCRAAKEPTSEIGAYSCGCQAAKDFLAFCQKAATPAHDFSGGMDCSKA